MTCHGTSGSLSTTRSRRSTSAPTSVRSVVTSLSIVPPQDRFQVSPWASSKWSHTDIPRLVKGKVGAQVLRETFLIHGISLPTHLSCGWPTLPVGPSTRTPCRSPWSRSTWSRGWWPTTASTYSWSPLPMVRYWFWKKCPKFPKLQTWWASTSLGRLQGWSRWSQATP